MKYFTLLFLICFISSCDQFKDDSDFREKNRVGWITQHLKPIIENAIFFKDDQTQLCFAALGLTIFSVPCTSEVERIAIHVSSRKL